MYFISHIYIYLYYLLLLIYMYICTTSTPIRNQHHKHANSFPCCTLHTMHVGYLCLIQSTSISWLVSAELIRRHWRQESTDAVAVCRFWAVLKGLHIITKVKQWLNIKYIETIIYYLWKTFQCLIHVCDWKCNFYYLLLYICRYLAIWTLPMDCRWHPIFNALQVSDYLNSQWCHILICFTFYRTIWLWTYGLPTTEL